MIFFGVLGDAGSSIEFIGSFSGDSSFSGISIGTASLTRRVIVVAHARGNAAGADPELTSCTIGGSAATIHVSGGNHNSGSGESVVCGVFSRVVTSGTTADIVFDVTSGTLASDCMIAVFVGHGLAASPTATVSAKANEGSRPATASLATPADGFAVWAAALSNGDPQDITISGPSGGSYREATSNGVAEGVYNLSTSSSAGVACSATWAAGDHGMAAAGVSWAFA